jgi:DNA polymerase III gamma/tau subunit
MEALLGSILANDRAATILSIHQFAGQGKNLETLFEEILTWLRGILLSLVLPDPGAVLDENPEKVNCYRKLAAITRADTLQILLEQLAASSYLLREAINKQVFMETILLKAMRAAHAVKVEDLLIRLNQIRQSGELAGIEKVPSLAQNPVHQVIPPTVPPVIPAPVPVRQPVSAAPAPAMVPSPELVPAQEEKPVEPPATPSDSSVPPTVVTPAPEPAVSSIEPKRKEPAPTEMTETEKPIKPVESKEINIIDEQMTESGSDELTEADPSGSESDNEGLPDETGEVSDELSDVPVPEVSSALQQRDSMSLAERYSAELLWRKLTERIVQVQPSLAGILTGAFPDRIEKSMLYVWFDTSDSAVSLPIAERNKPLIVNELKMMTGDSYADVSIGEKEGLRTQAAPKRSLEELKRAAEKNPMVQETADLFSGMIVDVLE